MLPLQLCKWKLDRKIYSNSLFGNMSNFSSWKIEVFCDNIILFQIVMFNIGLDENGYSCETVDRYRSLINLSSENYLRYFRNRKVDKIIVEGDFVYCIFIHLCDPKEKFFLGHPKNCIYIII